jgi:homoserine O-acetyltransferase
MVVLRRALESYDTTPEFAKIKAKVLYVISRTDNLFPPSIAPAYMQALRAAGVDARYSEIDSELGHLASACSRMAASREAASGYCAASCASMP